MTKTGQLYKSLSDMELNLMDEANRPGSDIDTASSAGGDAARGLEERTVHTEFRDGAPTTSKAAASGSALVRIFGWKKSNKSATTANRDHRAPVPASGGKGAAAASDDADACETAALIRAPPPELCFSDEEATDDPNAVHRPRWKRAARAMGRGIVGLFRFVLKHWLKILIGAIIITLIVLTAVKGFSIFGTVLRWFQARNNWAGWGIFLGMYTAIVALFLPGVACIMGAGFVFGFWKGLLAVWIGGAVGQALAFLLARYLLRDWVEATLRGKWRKWEVIDRALEHDGWKLVLIMRMSPIIPYNLLNIAMATTSMPFWQFTLVSAVGIVFECSIFCYIGSVASSVTSIVSGDAKGSVIEWILLGLSLVMCVLGAVFVSYSIKSAVRRADEFHAANSVSGRRGAGDESETPPLLPRGSGGAWHDPELGTVDRAETAVELRPVGPGTPLRVLVPKAAPEEEEEEEEEERREWPGVSGSEQMGRDNRVCDQQVTPSPPAIRLGEVATGPQSPGARDRRTTSDANAAASGSPSPLKRALAKSSSTAPRSQKAKQSPMPSLKAIATAGSLGLRKSGATSSGSDNSLAGSSPKGAHLGRADVELGTSVPKLRRQSGSQEG